MPSMALGSSHAGPGKKNTAAMPKPSRNSTPAPAPPASLPPQEFYDPDYLNTRVILFKNNLSYEDLVDQSAVYATVPDSKSVDAMLEKLKNLVNIMEKRSTFYDRGMRHLADERKKRPDDYDMRVDAEQEGKRSKHKRKKGSEAQTQDGMRLPSIAGPEHLRDRPTYHATCLRNHLLLTGSVYRSIIPCERCEAKALSSGLCELVIIARGCGISVGDGRR